ncbi:MAG TPA: cupin domain-containing protein [Pyrinomonadaceae bacterium]|jgi:mannose-6-phosphate isomerase-like protein (cupin superfamily)
MAKIIDPPEFRAERAWGALDIAKVEGATVRLHWTDSAYRWHTNDGAEVFVVLDGEVDMHYREGGEERVARLRAGQIFYAAQGDEHFASPVGEARVLVVEREGSV